MKIMESEIFRVYLQYLMIFLFVIWYVPMIFDIPLQYLIVFYNNGCFSTTFGVTSSFLYNNFSSIFDISLLYLIFLYGIWYFSKISDVPLQRRRIIRHKYGEIHISPLTWRKQESLNRWELIACCGILLIFQLD